MAGWQCDSCESSNPEGRNRPGLGFFGIAVSILAGFTVLVLGEELGLGARLFVWGIVIVGGLLFVVVDKLRK